MTERPILRAFDTLLATAPDAVLLRCPRRTFSRRDVDQLARSVAAACTLDSGGDDPPLVAVSAANGPLFLAAILACRRLDLGLVLHDATTPPTEQQAIHDALGIGALLAGDAWGEDWTWRALESGTTAPAGAAFVKLTSGSTGEPRGILTSEAALVADDAQLMTTMSLRDDDRFLGLVPMSHSYGLASLAMPALMRGCEIFLPEAGPLGGIRAFRDAPVEVVPTVPAVLAGVVSRGQAPASTIRLVVSAGAPLPPRTAREFLERFSRPVHSFYGASECGGITYDRTGESSLNGTLGTPVDGARVSVDGDADGGRVVVRSPATGSAYAPEASPELGDGCFRTGDLGRFEGAELRLIGRVDDVINIKGKKVHPATVEAVLRQAPGVADAVVLEHRSGTEAGLRAVIATESSGAAAFDRQALISWCRDRLADHKVPRSVLVVESLPRTDRGKLDRRALLDTL